jgi:hypothetical protein
VFHLKWLSCSKPEQIDRYSAKQWLKPTTCDVISSASTNFVSQYLLIFAGRWAVEFTIWEVVEVGSF